MSDGTFNRPRRQFEPRAHDERGRDFEAQQFRAPDQGATDQRDPGSDPLLELARLIGQTDPFAPAQGRANEAGKYDGRVAEVPRNLNSQDRNSQDRVSQDRATFARPPSRDYAPSRDQSHEDRPYQGRSSEDRLSLDETARGRHDPDFVRRDPQAAAPHVPVPSTHPDPDRSGMHYATDNSGFSRLSGRDEYPVAPQQAQADGEDYADGDHDADLQHQPAHDLQGEYDDEYAEDEYGQDGEYEYESEDEQPGDGRSGVKRRNTTKVVMAVLGLAVFGSAAAFGYRTIFKASPSGPTPVIRADNSPTKVMPAGADSNPKPINDRLGDRSGERLVRRDEDPIDVGASYRSGASGVVGTSGPFQGTTTPPPPATVPASTGPASPTDPKRVHTVTIRADQGAAAPDRTAPLDRAPPPSSRAAAPPRQAAAPPPPATSGAPTAITPDAAPARVAAAAPAPAPAPPVVPRPSEAGGFVVQLSAQKSEAEAQAAFRAMQAKYSALSGRQPLIRRKDQGERGIFYAAQVGPFGVKGDADQFCETLKSAGGSCFVQKN